MSNNIEFEGSTRSIFGLSFTLGSLIVLITQFKELTINKISMLIIVFILSLLILISGFKALTKTLNNKE